MGNSFSVYVLLLIFNIINATSVDNTFHDNLENSHGEIIYSSVLFRHGDRSPANPYPTDPYDESYWPEGLGQLTKLGKIQMYELGLWFRKRYNKMLLDGYNNNIMKMNSSDMDRTLMSAECFLAGFFPPTDKEMWSEDGLRWQPIPVHTVTAQYDNMIACKAPCERYDLEVDLLNKSPEFQAIYLENKDLYDFIGEHAGYTFSPNDVFSDLEDIWDLYDTLTIEKNYNLSIPLWTSKIYPEPLLTLAKASFTKSTYTLEMRRLKAGPLLSNIIEEMKMKRDGTLNQTFHFYSGHDITISALLNSLDIYNNINPPYASSVIFELRHKPLNSYFITILYRNSTTVEPYVLQIPNCTEFCTLDRFIQLTKYLIPDNWEYECSIDILTRLSYFGILELAVLIMVVLFLAALIISIIKLHMMRRKRYKHYEIIRNSVVNVDGEG